jgi:SAM-dependent methyltransferase/alpha-beta hydrolase superfamily lysophospholipase
MYVTLEETIPIVLRQPAVLNFESDAGILSINGAVCGVREMWHAEMNASDHTRAGIAIEFMALSHTDAQVLASLIDGVRERSTSVRLTVLLSSLETDDLLLEASQDSKELTKVHPCAPGKPVWVNGDVEKKVNRTVYAGVSSMPHYDAEHRRVTECVDPLLQQCNLRNGSIDTTDVVSEWMQCWSLSGGKLAFYYDHPRAAHMMNSPVVVLAPGYGETKKDHVALSYHLACNGFNVLRFDYTNHVGESDGEMERFTLSGMQRDLCAMVDYAARTWPLSPISVVATSLSGRVALRALRANRKVTALILINAVVDLQETLICVHKEDYIGDYLRGKTRGGYVNMLGFNIEADPWLRDVIQTRYADLASTLDDAEQLGVPVIMFLSEGDAWVGRESVARVQTAFGHNLKHTYYIPEALHRLSENPRKAKAVYSQVVAYLLKASSPNAAENHLTEPAPQAIRRQGRLERERARAVHQMTKSEHLAFWKDYLEHFHYVINVPDFWRLLDHIYGMLGTLRGGELILDAGCGNGTFGYYFLTNQIYRKRIASGEAYKPPRYVGLDFVPTALREAGRSFRHLRLSQANSGAIGSSPAAPMACDPLCQADLNTPLPFQNDVFDRVVCNLVIGYVDDPLKTIREFVRVLAPGGRLIVTNLKPQSDLTQVYRNFFNMARQQEEVDEARELLNNSGKIKQGEGDGIFHFFDQKELAQLLVLAGTSPPRLYSTLCNQAYLVVAEKPAIGYYRSYSDRSNSLKSLVSTTRC